MNDLEILQELNLSVLVPRDAEAEAAPEPAQPQSAAPALLVYLAENQNAFSDAHQTQLQKIISYLGFAESEYGLCFADTPPAAAETILAFGQAPGAANIQTHSISAMLENPSIKREVLHAIQPLKRNA